MPQAVEHIREDSAVKEVLLRAKGAQDVGHRSSPDGRGQPEAGTQVLRRSRSAHGIHWHDIWFPASFGNRVFPSTQRRIPRGTFDVGLLRRGFTLDRTWPGA